MSEKPNYNKDFILDLSFSVPCVHIPRDLIAIRMTTQIVDYLNKNLEKGLSLKEVLFDITGDEKYNG